MKENVLGVVALVATTAAFKSITGVPLTALRPFFGWWGKATAQRIYEKHEWVKTHGIPKGMSESDVYVPPMHNRY